MVGSTRLQLTLASLGNLDNDLAPSVSASERHQGVGDGFQPYELLIRKHSPPELALGDQLHQPVPDLGDGFPFLDRVLAPEEANDADVLQEDLVHGYLLDVPTGEANDQNAAVPRRALGALVNKADWVVDDVDTPALGSKLLDYLGPVVVPVVHHMVRSIRLGNLELSGRAGRRYNDSTERLGNLTEGKVSYVGVRGEEHCLGILLCTAARPTPPAAACTST